MYNTIKIKSSKNETNICLYLFKYYSFIYFLNELYYRFFTVIV